MSDLFQTARELIAVESITGNEEPVVQLLEARLKAMGLAVRSQEVEPGRRNLIAGPEQPSIIFCTHTDTVPPFLPLREDDEHLYGRGACDTKGITACFLEAGRRLLAEGFHDFGYLFVVGEEVDNAGAKRANEEIRAKYIIVGEPTENQLAVGHKGAVGARVTARGQACHSAYPQLGSSAVHHLVNGLHRVLHTDFGSDETLGQATVNIGSIRGGIAANVMAPSAESVVFIRVVGSLDETERRLLACFEDPQSGEIDDHIQVTIYLRMPPPKLHYVDGFGRTLVAYGTDIPFLTDIGQPLLFGPGSIHHAHTDDEKIRKADMLEAVEHYVALVRKLSGH